MTTLASSATLTVGDGAVDVESVTLSVLPAMGAGSGTGRLIHPTLGTYDYLLPPNEWYNMYGDAIIAPIWASERTLSSDSNTMWAGNVKDVVVEEHWTGEGGLSIPAAQLAMLLAMWQAPPDPADGYVQWYPSYINANGYNVVLLAITVEGVKAGANAGVVLDHYVKAGYAQGAVALQMRLVSKL